MIFVLIFAKGFLIASKGFDDDILLVCFNPVSGGDPLVAGGVIVLLPSIVLHNN